MFVYTLIHQRYILSFCLFSLFFDHKSHILLTSQFSARKQVVESFKLLCFCHTFFNYAAIENIVFNIFSRGQTNDGLQYKGATYLLEQTNLARPYHPSNPLNPVSPFTHYKNRCYIRSNKYEGKDNNTS